MRAPNSKEQGRRRRGGATNKEKEGREKKRGSLLIRGGREGAFL